MIEVTADQIYVVGLDRRGKATGAPLVIVFVDPFGYFRVPYNQNLQVMKANLEGQLNGWFTPLTEYLNG